MDCQPRGEWAWDAVLAHRPATQRAELARRLEGVGLTPAAVREALADGGDALFEASRSSDPSWANEHGGALAVALLAAEISAFAAHLNSRASAIRAQAVDALLEDYSAVAVAAALGISRQKVYEVSRREPTAEYINRVPWRAE